MATPSASFPFGGSDEIGALVFDFGSVTCRVGFAGEDTPKGVFPTAVGNPPKTDRPAVPPPRPMEEDAEMDVPAPPPYHWLVGHNALNYRRDNVEVVNPMKDGLVENWDIFEALCDHAYRSRLYSESKEHPLLFTEPGFSTNAQREKLTELMFEKFEVPALFVAKSPVLNCFAYGKSSGVVLDIGGAVTTATPVVDGYALKKALVRSPVAGEALTDFLLRLVEERGPVRPAYAVKRRAQGDQPAVLLDFPHTHPSFVRYAQREVVRDLKESVCRVSEIAFDERVLASIPSVSYDLPDGTPVDLGAHRFRVPEALFTPSLLGVEERGVHEMVVAAVHACDLDVRRELLQNVIVTGGSSLFPMLPERLTTELTQQVQAYKIKTIAPTLGAERRFGAWIGGSILASLGTFHQLWMSRQEYQEHGKILVEKKCP